MTTDLKRYFKETFFTSFDRTVSLTTFHQRPDRFRMLEDKQEILQIARGGGFSFSPASFGKNVLVKEMLSFNRILEFIESSKIVIVEAGITLAKLLEWSYKKRLFFPVQPGWPRITVGGCIAASAHGKNPHKDGTFVDHVEWIELFHPTFGRKIVSRSNEAKIFEATCGGLGLTGIITKVALRLRDLPSNSLIIMPRKAETLEDALRIMKDNANQDILYSWHIGSTLLNFGKGIVRIGSFSEKNNSDKLFLPKIKNLSSDNKLPPFALWNNLSSSIINTINRKVEVVKGDIEKDLFSGLFPFIDKANIFYTLYGSKGFNESQILINENQSNEFLMDLTKLIHAEKPSLTLLFMKLFKGERKYLRFSGNGLSVTLNLKHCSSTLRFLEKLDNLIISYKSIPHIIKDSRLSKNVVEQCFPGYYDFKEILKQIDPKRIYKSEVSKRLDL